MDCALTNAFAAPSEFLASGTLLPATGQQSAVGSSNERQVSPTPLHRRERWRMQDFIGYEITMVPEVECVFVEKEDDASFTVYTVVNDRDLDVRSKIYDREMEILGANPGIKIEFNILSRRNRPLGTVIQSKEKPYKPIRAAAA